MPISEWLLWLCTASAVWIALRIFTPEDLSFGQGRAPTGSHRKAYFAQLIQQNRLSFGLLASAALVGILLIVAVAVRLLAAGTFDVTSAASSLAAFANIGIATRAGRIHRDTSKRLDDYVAGRESIAESTVT